jgi:hypothetical protein
MNIFVLHANPKLAARWHADKHVVKMILESVQMLYTAHWATAFPFLLKFRAPIHLSAAQKRLPVPPHLASAPARGKGTAPDPYRPVHIHHPCTIWTRMSKDNYIWLCQLTQELLKEYYYRWDRTLGSHACQAHADWLLANVPALPAKTPLTQFVTAMPDLYKKPDPIESYRAFYSGSKTDRGITDNYTKREKPYWLGNT